MNHEEEITIISNIFERSGIPNTKKVKIRRFGKKDYMDIDILGIYKNIVILVECVGKGTFGNKVKEFKSESEFIEKNFNLLISTLKKEHKDFFERCKQIGKFKKREIVIKKLIIYSEKEELEVERESVLKEEGIYPWDRCLIEYFTLIADTTFSHCRYEIISFLDIDPVQIKEKVTLTPLSQTLAIKIEDNDREVVVFKLSARELLERSNVKRYHSWLPQGFQRLLRKDKLKKMREFLLENKKSYPNNIIVVLHPEVNIEDLKNLPKEMKSTDKNMIEENICMIRFPDKFDVFLIIDGQHRLYSFAQDKYAKHKKIKGKTTGKLKEEDEEINELANSLNLLVTGIKFKNANELDEKTIDIDAAYLFYIINTKQTHLSSEDKIDLTTLINPDDPISRANKLIIRLNKEGVLKDKIKVKFYHGGRIARSSLISYSGLKDIFNEKSKTHAIYNNIYQKQKEFGEYDDFCLKIINIYLLAIKDALEKHFGKKVSRKMWKDTRHRNYYFMTVTSIGAFLRLLRHFFSENDKAFPKIREFISDGILKNEKDLRNEFKRGLIEAIKEIPLEKEQWEQKGYKSSQWALLERDMFDLIITNIKGFGDKKLVGKR